MFTPHTDIATIPLKRDQVLRARLVTLQANWRAPARLLVDLRTFKESESYSGPTPKGVMFDREALVLLIPALQRALALLDRIDKDDHGPQHG